MKIVSTNLVSHIIKINLVSKNYDIINGSETSEPAQAAGSKLSKGSH
jgi:hypothetical protein